MRPRAFAGLAQRENFAIGESLLTEISEISVFRARAERSWAAAPPPAAGGGERPSGTKADRGAAVETPRAPKTAKCGIVDLVVFPDGARSAKKLPSEGLLYSVLFYNRGKSLPMPTGSPRVTAK